ncbi:MAG: polysaccharide pyruvyl transferase family protein [Rhodoglobus sp.]
MSVSIFVPGVGQYDNIGDIILRRQLIDWLRPLGQLHIYLGPSPDGYSEGLGVTDGDITYRSFSSWYRAGLARALRGNTSYVFKPGEIQLTLVGMKEHIAMIPLALLVRLRRGGVLRVGVGSRNFARIPRLLMQPSIALSQLTRWRDPRTAAYLRGAGMPDLAFGEGSSSVDRPHNRKVLVVEMRADRPYPSKNWITAVKTFAERNQLQIWAVAQVLRDREHSRRLAEDLGGVLLDWDGTSHAAQEASLRELYTKANVVVSDRLHVLVTAFTEGAVPVAPLVDASDKIERHFRAAGIEGIAFPTESLDSQQITAAIAAVEQRRDELFAALASARNELEQVRREVTAVVTRGSVNRPRGSVDAVAPS